MGEARRKMLARRKLEEEAEDWRFMNTFPGVMAGQPGGLSWRNKRRHFDGARIESLWIFFPRRIPLELKGIADE